MNLKKVKTESSYVHPERSRARCTLCGLRIRGEMHLDGEDCKKNRAKNRGK